MDPLTSLEMRRLDERAIHRYVIAAFVLMDHAGKAVAEAARRLSVPKCGGIAVVCGGGNNGGDGVVAARWLKGWGYRAEVLWLKDPAAWKGSLALHYSIARRLGVRFRPFRTTVQAARFSVMIDALLGTGTTGELREPYRGTGGDGPFFLTCSERRRRNRLKSAKCRTVPLFVIDTCNEEKRVECIFASIRAIFPRDALRGKFGIVRTKMERRKKQAENRNYNEVNCRNLRTHRRFSRIGVCHHVG